MQQKVTCVFSGPYPGCEKGTVILLRWETINHYDAVSDVLESGVHWRSDFQIGSRVLKICFKPILMHIYGMQYDFMHRSC